MSDLPVAISAAGHHDTNWRSTMSYLSEELARAHVAARLGEAHELRRGHRLASTRRLSRRAERAADQARLALARSS